MRHVTALATALAIGLLIVPSAADTAHVAPGDKVRGHLEAGETDTLSFTVTAPSAMDMKSKLQGDLVVAFSVFAPDGEPVDTTGLLKKPTSRKPSFKGIPLDQAGVYRLQIAQVAGSGGYDIQLRMKSRKPRTVDVISSDDFAPPVVVDARHVRMPEDGAPLDERLSSFDTRVGSIDTVLAELDARLTSVENPPAGDEPEAMRVLWALEETQEVDAVATVIPNTGAGAYAVRRHRVARIQVPAGTVKSLIRADLSWVLHATLGAGSNVSSIGPQGEAAWMEIGSDVVFLTQYYPRADGSSELVNDTVLGVDHPSIPSPQPLKWRMIHAPTEAQRDAGFTIDLYVAAVVRATVSSGTFIDGFRLDVDAAMISGY